MELHEQSALGGAGLRAFEKIADAWRLSVAEQLTLLGIASRSTFFKWRRERNPRLRRDTLERIPIEVAVTANRRDARARRAGDNQCCLRRR